MSKQKYIDEPLQQTEILLAIDSENQPYLTTLEIFQKLPSTNSYLLDAIRRGALSGSVCLAEEQTAGRGRLGRAWVSPQGANIYCSLLWMFERDSLAGLSVAVAVILLRALKKYDSQIALQLKWPNDLLSAGRKLAGILLEARGKHVVIGIGLNVILPQQAEPAWIGLTDMLHSPVKRNQLVGLLLNELVVGLQCFEKSGLTSFLSDWQAHDYLHTKTVNLTTPRFTLQGMAKGINAEGELLIHVTGEEAVRAFSYGEVSVRVAGKSS